MSQLDTPDLKRPITGSALREFLSNRRIVRSGVRPSPEACDRLAAKLNRLEDAMLASFLADPDGAATQIAEALETLTARLPAIRPTLAGADAEILDQLARAVDTARPRAWATRPPQEREISKWQEIATELVAAFREAMAPTNPGVKFGLSNTGPVARFTAAMITNITGARPTCDAVARYLQRQQRKATGE